MKRYSTLVLFFGALSIFSIAQAQKPQRVLDVQNMREGESVEYCITHKKHAAIYTFVAVDQNGNPIQVPELIPETDEEKMRYEGALRRKQLALILAGKMKASEATELKKLFLDNA